MKSDRRKFIQTLGAGAAGITRGTAAISTASCSSPAGKRENEYGQKIIGLEPYRII